MNERDAEVLHEVLAADRRARASCPEDELGVRWQRFCDRRRHERPPRAGTAPSPAGHDDVHTADG